MRVEYYCGKRPETSDLKENLNNSKTNKKRVLRNSCVLLNDELEPRHEDGDYYCLMHLPDENKSSNFNKLFKETFNKLKEGKEKFGFHGYWFPKQSAELLESCFSSYIFNNEVSFRSAVFNSEINFSSSEFKQKVSFWDACFKEESTFTNIEFNSETTFAHAIFENKVNFWRSKFKGETFFYKTNFKLSADFSDTTFSNYVIFRGELDDNGEPNTWIVDLEDARFEKPEQTIFQSVRLHPYHFISHQPRKFVFVDVTWENSDGSKEKVKNELDEIKKISNHKIEAQNERDNQLEIEKTDEQKIETQIEPGKEKESIVLPPNLKRLLNVTCNQLAANAEENSRFKDASKFRRMAFELERLDREERGEIDFLHSLYRWTSGYGESWNWALGVLFAIWIIFAFLYAIPPIQMAGFQLDPQFAVSKNSNSEDQEPKSALIKKRNYEFANPSAQSISNFGELILESAAYSLGVLTLQKPEPNPANLSAKLTVMLETILGPLQLALLALAIRRKFMR